MEVKKLKKRYYKKGDNYVDALKEVDFRLEEGEFIIIMGSSGSGKSTLLQILGGLDSPTAGDIFINGEKIGEFNEEPFATEYRKKNIGFVFQFYNLIQALSVGENVSLPLILRGDSSKDIKNMTKEILNLVGLSEREKHIPSELSGGQQQRVALARALITSPAILLADEPTGNLDSKTSTEILELIDETRKKLNQSIVLVTHDPRVATYGDRVNPNMTREENTIFIMRKLHEVIKES
ncbi:ABC transporter ATP-binding protein [Metabacillus halosaccharovorans]|uniref:ABC transporter ATP-binding protein n=1 Tax=Metabacillus halosaccharovorans TaxID=930124 RepID=A0ABT3DNQ3_9BACI|nr:ABC transporter ATP-binding protein [Metabacillus halosaccharovorans]MCV9888693.1 ABC transporter ATP-binding protein [Metabacillus halosaccharovorans]